MKVLVTGANGFIGKHMTRALTSSGYDVFAYDINNTEEDLEKFISEADFIVHLAGINRPLTTSEFYNGNSNFTKKLLDFQDILNKKTPIIMSSSIQAELDNDYGKSKKMAEDFLLNSGIPVYVFRLANVFGKWCRPNYNSAAATFMFNIAHNLPIEIRDRNYVVHYNYVDDIVETFMKCIEGTIKPSSNILKVEPVYDCSLGDLADTLYYFKNTVESDKHLPEIKNEFQTKLFISFLDYLKDENYNYNFAKDSRGSFEEVYKNKKYGQISVNISYPNITKGGHYHTYKNEIFMTVKGNCINRLRKIDTKEINSFNQNDDNYSQVYITPNYTHDITNIGKGNSVTIMWISEVYSDETSDTFREDVDIK